MEGTDRLAAPEAPRELHLVIAAADGTWRAHQLPPRGAVTIGRDPDVDVRIDERAVSRRHARLEITAGGMNVVDLDSANGTRVGGDLVRNARIGVWPGTSILIGHSVLTIHAPPPGARPVLSNRPSTACDELIARVAPTMVHVLLLGETGVGKDVIAERIHRQSPRAAHPLVRLNCATLTPGLLESELFGHERGAFTGADQARLGLLESAAGGTVFLDEIGEMPPEVQAKLLLAIEHRAVRRVGASHSRPIDVRFISATHRDLDAEIRAGRFRADFYHRINGMPIRIAPLRERLDELDDLAMTFAMAAADRLGRPPPLIAPEARALLHQCRWPGNVRQLRSVIERAVLLSDDGAITSDLLALAELPGAGADAGSTAAPASPEPLGDPERARVIDALARCAGNQTRAARLLGIARNTLRARIKKLALPCPHGPEER